LDNFNSMATARRLLGGAGTQTAGLAFGGYTTNWKAATEEFNSTIFSPATGAWASGGNLNTARNDLAGAGTQTAALGFWWKTPAATGATEEYNGSSLDC
jgi:hypothetical protein